MSKYSPDINVSIVELSKCIFNLMYIIIWCNTVEQMNALHATAAKMQSSEMVYCTIIMILITRKIEKFWIECCSRKYIMVG